MLPAESPPPNAESEFTTDFSKHLMLYSEILSGALKFQSASDADEWLNDREPVVFIQVNEEAKTYPIQILIWHDVVSDTVGGKPLMVSFCPLWILF